MAATTGCFFDFYDLIADVMEQGIHRLPPLLDSTIVQVSTRVSRETLGTALVTQIHFQVRRFNVEPAMSGFRSRGACKGQPKITFHLPTDATEAMVSRPELNWNNTSRQPLIQSSADIISVVINVQEGNRQKFKECRWQRAFVTGRFSAFKHRIHVQNTDAPRRRGGGTWTISTGRSPAPCLSPTRPKSGYGLCRKTGIFCGFRSRQGVARLLGQERKDLTLGYRGTAVRGVEGDAPVRGEQFRAIELNFENPELTFDGVVRPEHRVGTQKTAVVRANSRREPDPIAVLGKGFAHDRSDVRVIVADGRPRADAGGRRFQNNFNA